MGKTILGVDIGYDSMKLALVKDGIVKKAVTVSMPKNLLREGRVVSPESMGELIRKAMKQSGIHCSRGALVLPNESVFIRNVVMPVMTEDQLKYNLPFEFRDYITEELKNYVFDYAMVTTPEQLRAGARAGGGDGVGRSMELMAVAAPVSLIEDAKEFFRKAGLKLVKAAPSVSGSLPRIRLHASQRGVWRRLKGAAIHTSSYPYDPTRPAGALTSSAWKAPYE